MIRKKLEISFPALGEIFIDRGVNNNLIKFCLLKKFRVGYENKGSDSYKDSKDTETGRFLYFGFFSVEYRPSGWLFYDHPF